MITFGRPKMAELEPWPASFQVWRSVVAPDHQDLLRRKQRSIGLYALRRQVHEASDISVAGTGDGGADFVLGLDNSIRPRSKHREDLGAIQQHDWNLRPRYLAVTDRFTLISGLRYDAHTPWVETTISKPITTLLPAISISPARMEPAAHFTKASTGAGTSSRALVLPGLRLRWATRRSFAAPSLSPRTSKVRYKPSIDA